MQITIHNRTTTNLNLKLSSISSESHDTINIPQNQTKMILTQTSENVLELSESEFPFDTKRFYEVKSPAEILVNKTDEVFIFDENRNLKKLEFAEEKEFFESKTIHVVNLSGKSVYVRIDKPEKFDNYNNNVNCNYNNRNCNDYFVINSGAIFCWKRNLNEFYILQVGVLDGSCNGINYVVKAGYEFSINDDLNVISNLTAQIYYTHKNWNECVYDNDVLTFDLSNDMTPMSQRTDAGFITEKGNYSQVQTTNQTFNDHEKIQCKVYQNDKLNLLKLKQNENLIIHNDSDYNLSIRIKSIGVGDEEIIKIDPKNNFKWPRESGFYLTEFSYVLSNFNNFNVENNQSEKYISCFYLQENKIYVFTQDFFVVEYATCEILKPSEDKFSTDTLGYFDSATYHEINKLISENDQIFFYDSDSNKNEIDLKLQEYRLRREKIENNKFNLCFNVPDNHSNYNNNYNDYRNTNKNQKYKKLSDDLYDLNQINNQNSFNFLHKSNLTYNNSNNNNKSLSQAKVIYENLNVDSYNKFEDINEIGYENSFDINNLKRQLVNNPNNDNSYNNNNKYSSNFKNSNENQNLKTSTIKNLSEKTICIRTQSSENAKSTDGYSIIPLGDSTSISREAGLYILEINTVKKRKFYFKIQIGFEFKYLEDGFLLNSSTGETIDFIIAVENNQNNQNNNNNQYLLESESDPLQIAFIQNFFTNNLFSTVETLLSKKEFCGICLLELDAFKESLESHFQNKHTINFGKSILLDTPNGDDDHLSKDSTNDKNRIKEIDNYFKKNLDISQSKNIVGEENLKKSLFDYAKLFDDDKDLIQKPKGEEEIKINFNFAGSCNNNLFENRNKNENENQKNCDIKANDDNGNYNAKFDVNDISINNESKHFMNKMKSNKNNDEKHDKKNNNNKQNNDNQNIKNKNNNYSVNIVNNSTNQKIINVNVQPRIIENQFNKEKLNLFEKLLLKIDEKIDQIQKQIETDWEKRVKEKAESEAFNKKLENNYMEIHSNINLNNNKFNENLHNNNKLLIELKAEQLQVKNTMQKQCGKLEEKIVQIQNQIDTDCKIREKEKAESEAFNKKLEVNYMEIHSNIDLSNNKFNENLHNNNKLLNELKSEHLQVKNALNNQNRKFEEKINHVHKQIETDSRKREKEKAENEAFNTNLVKNFNEINSNINFYNDKFEENLQNNNKLLNELKSEHLQVKNALDNQDGKIQSLTDFLIEKHDEIKEIHKMLSKNACLNFDEKKFHKIEKDLFQINLKLAENKKEAIDFSIPNHWKKHQSHDLLLCKINTTSTEYINLQKSFLSTLPNAKVKEITRVQNLSLWKNFCFAKHQLAQKGNAAEKFLFHGTRKTNPEIIYGGKEEGFDMRFCSQGYWGIGCYFHQNALYSNDYRYTKNSVSGGNTNIMLVVNVLVGNSKTLARDGKLRLPPLIPGSETERYDSVNSGDGIYIVYNNQRAYPAYIIEYDD